MNSVGGFYEFARTFIIFGFLSICTVCLLVNFVMGYLVSEDLVTRKCAGIADRCIMPINCCCMVFVLLVLGIVYNEAPPGGLRGG